MKALAVARPLLQTRGRETYKRDASREDFTSGKGASRRGVAPLSTLIYGRLRTANYRHIQLILASVFPPPVPRSPSLSHLCVASPSPSPITPNPLSHRPPSPLLLPRFVPLHPSPPPLALPPFPNHLTSNRPSISPAPFSRTILYALPWSLSLSLSPALSRLLSPSPPRFLVFPFPLSIQQVPGHASQISHVRGGDAGDYGRIRSRARAPFAEFRRNFQVHIPSMVPYLSPVGRNRGNNDQVSPIDEIINPRYAYTLVLTSLSLPSNALSRHVERRASRFTRFESIFA